MDSSTNNNNNSSSSNSNSNSNNSNSRYIKKEKVKATSNKIDIGDFDEISEKYKIVQDYRMQNDFFYRFFFDPKLEFMQSHMETLLQVCTLSYGPNSEQKMCLEDSEIEIIKKITYGKNNMLKYAYFLMSIYLLPQVVNWLLNGSPGSPRPLSPNIEWLRYFIVTILPSLCENLLNGAIQIEDFVRSAKSEYFATVGIPLIENNNNNLSISN